MIQVKVGEFIIICLISSISGGKGSGNSNWNNLTTNTLLLFLTADLTSSIHQKLSKIPSERMKMKRPVFFTIN